METQDRIIDALYWYTRALSVALGYRDYPTQLHSERVRDLALELGALCGLTPWEMGILRISAAFHDIGKIGVTDNILTKPGQLDAEEWVKIKQHCEIGQAILLATELNGAREAARIIRHHHEHFDGRGYPDGLAGEDIPLSSRIIAIVDSYDAMAVRRSYHGARRHDEIMTILHEETGSKHDPQLMSVFCGMIEASGFRTA